MKNVLIALGFMCSLACQAKVWTVDPSGTYTTPAAVSNLVADGDTIYIMASLYKNHPQVAFAKNNLLIKGINGRPRLEAGSTLAAKSNGKAIFVISGMHCHVDNIEFAYAVVPDHNGAGIRQEGCDLLVTHCFFNGNEMGILGGNLSPCKVVMEHCLFANNGSPSNPGYQHNIYINHIDTFVFRYNYTVNAIAEGHELKSRAHHNIIIYNYIGNLNSVDSRNIDLPNGGTAVVVGNIIEQNQNSANSNILGYGMEGLSNPSPHNLWVANNTFINKKEKGSFVQINDATDTLLLKNNIMVGAKTGGLIIGTASHLDSGNNFISNDLTSAGMEDVTNAHYQLKSGSPCINAGATVSRKVYSYALKPTLEYADTADFRARPDDGKIDIGAFEFLGLVSVSEIQKNSHHIFPNPSNGEYLFFSVSGITPFEIYSSEGRYMYGGVFIHGRADIKTLPSGIYILRVEDFTVKLIRN